MSKKDPLQFDAATHTYTRHDGIVLPSITQIISLIDTNTEYYNEVSAKLGSNRHKMLQYYDEGDLDETTVLPEYAPYLDGWKKFRSESGFKPTVIECKLYHKVYDFAGTPDRAGTLNGGTVVLEIKTGQISRLTGLQLAGQQMLFLNNGISVYDRYAVQLFGDGSYLLKKYDNPSDEMVFCALLTVWNWIKNYE